MENMLPIPIAFVVVVALMLWMIIGAKGKWAVKLAVILFVPALSIVIWRSLDSYLGWPTPEEPPSRSIFLWGAVREPNEKEGDEGEIFIWLLPVKYKEQDKGDYKIFEYEPEAREPRAYKVRYSRGLHEGLEEAKKMIGEGKTVFFGRAGDGSAGDGPPGEGIGDARGRDGSGGFSHGDDEFRFYDLPPSLFRPKE